MSLLVVSPDFASHLLPLAALASAWRDAGEEVVVATGPATTGVVASFGYRRVELRLGRGANAGVMRPAEQVSAEAASLRGFFAATRRGPVATLLHQARERGTDLLWEPLATARALLDVVDAVQPDQVLVDHLAFSARLGLRAAGVPHGDVVLGHPSALPVADELYGLPPAWPAAVRPESAELAELAQVCREVTGAFTAQWNAATSALAPSAPAVDDAFQVAGDVLLLNYPQALHDPARTALLGSPTFLGAALREEDVPDDVAAWLADRDGEPFVYVSFGTFLSERADVLARVAAALRVVGLPVALALGAADPAELGPLPTQWLAREQLPQVAVLRRAALAVTHGGNNSVTEALACGVPLLVLPFSTDQFAGAAAVETAGVGVVLDPGTAGPDALAAAVRAALSGPVPQRAAALGEQLCSEPGPQLARAAMHSCAATGS